ncbi:MAG: class I SAM-dependent methyltransferase [bacterium]
MLRLSNILHPIRFANSLYKRASTAANKRITKNYPDNIRRGRRDRCWCGGGLSPFKLHPSYGKCSECGCYVNMCPPIDEEMTQVYSINQCCHSRQRLKGGMTFEKRPGNIIPKGQLEYWLGLIERYSLFKGLVIEVGCGYGILLTELNDRGYDCIGVEPDAQIAELTRHNTCLDIRSGFFPYVVLPKCDFFLAFDVIQNSSDPVAFIKRVGQLLNLGGIAIIQTPVEKNDDNPPFREMFDKIFDDLEHLYVFTKKSLGRLIDIANLQLIIEEGWDSTSEVVVLRKESIAHE